MEAWPKPTNIKTLNRARQLRRDSTDAERKLWGALRGSRLAGVKFRRQVPIGPFVADFCCEQCKLVIEVDGGQHAESVARGHQRTEWLGARGYRVLRFWNNEVLENMDGVLSVILSAVAGGSKKVQGA